ncbi:MAG: zinc-dependent metalloprotease, partial [Microthrixaceae bacterium]|nr:zinc-dependent metalloprotease [Microthrixaceae bacterium]
GKLRDAGLIMPIDTGRLTHWNDFFPELRQVENVDGQQWIAPCSWGNSSVIYRRDLIQPKEESWGERLDERMTAPAAVVSGKVAAAELGALLGWMSQRVLGQYDLLVLEEEDPDDQDIVYFVGPNILGLEKRHGFPPEQFRMWVALHEVTHRTQFTGVPWLREHFLGLVSSLLDEADPDPARLFTAFGRVAEGIRTRTNPLDDGGLSALFASGAQREVMDRMGGLMSLLEGHGDVTMDRAALERVPQAERFARVLRARRRDMGLATRLLSRLIGLEAKLNQYEQGEAFIAAVEDAGGTPALNRAFEEPANLPTRAEILDPSAWLARVAVDAA